MGHVPCRAMIGWFGKKSILTKNGVLKLVRRPPTLRKMLWSRYYAQWNSNYKFGRQNNWISISNTNLAAQGYFWAFKLRACCDQASVREALAYKKCWGSRMNKNEYKWMYTIFKTIYYCLKINLKLSTWWEKGGTWSFYVAFLCCLFYAAFFVAFLSFIEVCLFYVAFFPLGKSIWRETLSTGAVESERNVLAVILSRYNTSWGRSVRHITLLTSSLSLLI